MNRFVLALLMLCSWVSSPAQGAAPPQRWSEERANAWYQQEPWLVGSNFIPATAINELETWQASTFDTQEIDRELRWAEALGMNTMRVFLHDLLWEQDAADFKERIDQFLTISAKHHIRPILVLFNSCWDPFPVLGPQHPAISGVHNSGWVQSPGAAALRDPAQYRVSKLMCKGQSAPSQTIHAFWRGTSGMNLMVSILVLTRSLNLRTSWNSSENC